MPKTTKKGDWTQLSMPLPSDPGRHTRRDAPAPSFSVDAWRILRLFVQQKFDRPPTTHAIAQILGMSAGDAAAACAQLAPYWLIIPVTFETTEVDSRGIQHRVLATGWKPGGVRFREVFKEYGIAALAAAESATAPGGTAEG